jgi:hypothetical protein
MKEQETLQERDDDDNDEMYLVSFPGFESRLVQPVDIFKCVIYVSLVMNDTDGGMTLMWEDQRIWRKPVLGQAVHLKSHKD